MFKFADAAVGINMPPIHHFCRCRITAPEQSLEDLERELDEMIDSWNIPEGMSLDEFIDRVNNGELEQIREEQAEKEAESVDFPEKSGIIKEDKDETVDKDVRYIGKIDIEKYEAVATKPIITDEVILTDNQAVHIIKQRGQEFYDKYNSRFGEVVTNPDYVMKDKDETRVNTAIAAKAFYEDGKVVNVVVSLAVEGDNPTHKNSIITAIGQSEKRFKQTLRNNPPIYIKTLDKNE